VENKLKPRTKSRNAGVSIFRVEVSQIGKAALHREVTERNGSKMTGVANQSQGQGNGGQSQVGPMETMGNTPAKEEEV
jgi:hypothetical protein